MKTIALIDALVLSVASAGTLALAQQMHAVKAGQLCVTEGHVREMSEGMLAVDDTKTRAVLCRSIQNAAEIRFRYAGPTAKQSALGSGAVRTQIGLKLNAKDACNLIYVMWQIEPQSQLVVSRKSNPGQHTSAQCENRGYRRIKADREAAAPTVESGSTHTLRAEIRGNSLMVAADEKAT